jgi:hypothetical protein
MHIESLEVDEGCQGTAHENIDVDLKKSNKSIFKITNWKFFSLGSLSLPMSTS